MKARIIGLAGKSGSGKDLVADYLALKHGYRKIAVADAIRQEAAEWIDMALTETAWPGFDTPDYPGEHRLPKSFDVVRRAFIDAVWAKPTTPEQRVFLQWWGTEYRRSEDPEYWIDRLHERLDNDELIVVSDIRMIDEMDVVHIHGGQVWFVERPGVANVGIKGHATEHQLDNAMFDHYLLNNGTIAELEAKIDASIVFKS